MRLFRELGDDYYASIATGNLPWVLEELGDVEGARAIHEDSLRRARAKGDERQVAYPLGELGMFAINAGRLAEAAPMLREAIALDQRCGDVRLLASDLTRLASLLARAAQPDVAARLLGASSAVFEELGADEPWWVQRRNAETRAMVLETLGDAGLAALAEQGRALTHDQAVALALASATM